jgi:septum formation protein
MVSPHLILASASPRRRHLLQQAGLPFEVVPSDFDEEAVPFTQPEPHVKALARGKAASVGGRYPESWVIGADTTVVVGKNVLGKPKSMEEARAMLGRLSGRTHQVFTGYCLYNEDLNIARCHAIRSDVRFKQLSDQEIDWYIRTDEPYDKAGAYAVQGIGAALIRRIDGSYTNVVGLPLCEVVEGLLQEGVIAFDVDGPGGFRPCPSRRPAS